ncbi:hypothetical protein B5E92_01440 [Erysipelatoclostridium sp. An15]|nr:hypothetical protein B5E92_01440 [Erysipelatoclostridium sp. An15]
MVNKMKPLIKLKILKTKGSIRELFENKAAGIIIIFTGLIYLLGLGTMIGNTSASMQNNPLVNIMILIYIGFLAILIFSTFMSSRKALFFGEDAFYLFTGPFTKTQIMTYLTFQNLSQSLYLTLICFMIFVFFSTIVTVSLGFMILTAVVSMIAFFCFLILSDYLYVLSIGDRKYRKYSKIIPAIIIILVLVVVGLVYLQTGDYNNLLLNLIKSDLFYVIPIFGWIRLILVSFIEQNFLITLLTFLLLLITTVLIYYAFIKYQGDFYEQALQDGFEYPKVMKAAKEGNQRSISNQKVKTKITGKFKQGAWAILSKNFLIMRKGNELINKNDIVTLGIYIAITIFLKADLELFIYWVILWVFTAIRQSELARDMKNYQIYLIPENPFKKLLAVTIPTFIKVFVYAFFAFLIVGIYYHHGLGVIITYFMTILGYTGIIISGTILSLKFFKNLSSSFFETIMTIILMMIAAIPSTIILAFVVTSIDSQVLLVLGSYVSLIVNLVISLLILYYCRDMMNGWELNDK